MPSGSFEDYARVIAALPGTGAEVAERSGLTEWGAKMLLRQFWDLRMVHPGGVTETGPRAAHTAVWQIGDGERAPGLRVKKHKPKLNHYSFAVLWRCLEDGATKTEAIEASGLNHNTVRRTLEALHTGGAIRVSAWEKDSMGRSVIPVWIAGAGKDAKKPKPKSANESERWRRTYERRQIHLVTMLAQAGA
jgi:hypothetical protein